MTCLSINRRILLSSALASTLASALALSFSAIPAGAQPAGSITVFAAASLTDSLKAVADAYKGKTGHAVTLSFGASSTLARQIEQGARADIFFSADDEKMDYLQDRNLIASLRKKSDDLAVLVEWSEAGEPVDAEFAQALDALAQEVQAGHRRLHAALEDGVAVDAADLFGQLTGAHGFPFVPKCARISRTT